MANIRYRLARLDLQSVFNCALKAQTSDELDDRLTLQSRFKEIESIKDNFVQNHIALESSKKDDVDLKTHQENYVEFMETFHKINVMYSKIFPIVCPNVPSEYAPYTRNVCLPKLNLVSFSGKYTEWMNFISTFNSLIHNDKSLQHVQKFHYLLSTLTGEALNVVRHLPISEDNYLIAYQLLQKRFENKRLIADIHMENIISCSLKSRNELIAFIGTIKENILALQALKFPTKEWSFILLHIILRKLPIDIRTIFETSHHREEIPSFEQLINFLEIQCRAKENACHIASENINKHSKPKSYNSFLSNTDNNIQRVKCVVCNELHSLFQCPKFLSMSPKERYSVVKENRICLNCLSKFHLLKNCSSRSCKLCSSKHHTLLHFTSTNKIVNPSSNDNAPNHGVVVNSDSVFSAKAAIVDRMVYTNHSNCSILLSTAIAEVRDKTGRYQKVRVLLDSASQANFISENCATRLGFKYVKKNIPIRGICQMQSMANKGVVEGQVRAVGSREPLFDIEMIVLSNICSNMPSQNIDFSHWEHVENLKLADPEFYAPGPVDILLGAAVFPLLLKSGKIVGEKNEPTALNTAFGWILMGNIDVNSSKVLNTFFTSSERSIENSLSRFWEIEEPPQIVSPLQSPNDIRCEDIFQKEHRRDSSGRYIVPLPLVENAQELGSTHDIALSRLHHLERRLARNPKLKELYVHFMREYEALGHMTESTSIDMKSVKYFIPHHCVFKEHSSSTKLRVVFDASSRSSSQVSLNDILLCGPKLQTNIVDLMCRFRIHPIVFTADICKMFRQILIIPEYTSYQHILWRESIDLPVKQYTLETVTYGTASAPYLAQRSLRQLAQDEGVKYPEAAMILRENTYIDDILAGADTITHAQRLQQDLRNLLSLGGFTLRKWYSNCAEVLSDIPVEDRETPISLDFDQSQTIKVLGIYWDAANDSFSYYFTKMENKYTKRSILSNISKIYDPIGFLSPVLLFVKCLLQELWKLKLAWDDEVPNYIQKQWRLVLSSLSLLSNIKIPRFFGITKPLEYQLVGFCDGSEKGYGGVVYLRSIDSDSNTIVRLLIAKSRVAPVKPLSIPRLELCGALLLSNLLKYLINTLGNKICIQKIFAFTDSTIVLAWLNTPPYMLKTFVCHRVTKIIENTPSTQWYHVKSGENSADIASRGVLPTELIDSSLWWNGPSWLSTLCDNWPISNVNLNIEDVPERKSPLLPTVLAVQQGMEDFDIFKRYSSLGKLITVTAWCCRFIRNCRSPSSKREVNNYLNLCEINGARMVLIKHIQNICFYDEITALKSDDKIKSSIRNLAPFFDSNSILHVGGRLQHSNLTGNAKHPILLPKNHTFTHLLIDHFHKLYLHVGPRTLQSILLQNYWIVSARNVIRHRLSKCITCFRAKPQNIQPFMGDLPAPRFQEGRPFLNVGIDFGGPFTIKESKRRGAKTAKAYLCLFVCLSTKAVHLEVVSDMSSEAFLSSLDRFVARRGICHNIYSDCGTNFTGANKHLIGFSKLISSKEDRGSFLMAVTTRQIKWHFNPPSAPHFGGLWEAGIKSVKFHLKRVVGDQVLTFEELNTIFIRIEAILNSRPIGALSSDPSEDEALTPAHFLVGGPLVSVPEENFVETPMNRLSRWQLLKKMTQHFWNRWRREYLHTLQQRSKWTSSSANLSIGDLVLIEDSQSPPMQWPLGRITECFPGSDNILRVVNVRTSKGILKRPIVKLYKLPI